MDKNQWGKINEIVSDALDIPFELREAYVERVSGDDDALRQEVLELLAAENNSSVLEAESIYSLATFSDNFPNSPFATGSQSFKNSVIGEVLDKRYLITEHIGEGGMGYVFKANDMRLTNRLVVVKFLKPEILTEEYLLKKFQQEMEALARIKASGVIDIYDTGTFSEVPYLVTEYFEGIGLDVYLKNSPASLKTSAQIIKNIGRALLVAHQAGVIHRDLKPTNILVKTTSSEPEVKLIDFGIARINDSLVSNQTSQYGRTLGTVFYMSPEQLYGEANLTSASDIFSLGVIAYELFTSQRPFNPQSIAQLPDMHRQGVLIKPREINSEISERTSNAILKALNFNHLERFQTAAEFGDEIVESLSEKIQVSSKSFSSDQTEILSYDDETKDSRAEIASIVQNSKETVLSQSKLGIGKYLVFSAATFALVLLAGTGLWFGYRAMFPTPDISVSNKTSSPIPAQNLPVMPPAEREFSYSLKVQPTEKNREAFIASPLQTFLGGWRFRLQFESPQNGFLYLLSEGQNAKEESVLSILYPDPRLNGGIAEIEANKKVETNQYEFAKTPGVEKFWIIFSKTPVENFEEVKKYVNPQDLGEIKDKTKQQNARDFLQKYEAVKLTKDEDKAKQQLTVKGSGDVIIQLAELRHN